MQIKANVHLRTTNITVENWKKNQLFPWIPFIFCKCLLFCCKLEKMFFSCCPLKSFGNIWILKRKRRYGFFHTIIPCTTSFTFSPSLSLSLSLSLPLSFPLTFHSQSSSSFSLYLGSTPSRTLSCLELAIDPSVANEFANALRSSSVALLSFCFPTSGNKSILCWLP